jgi:hypothetical protein
MNATRALEMRQRALDRQLCLAIGVSMGSP